ncbi:hypothetical protein DMUE_2036 [Dictyocoela muelleri]|nr:hypothetical protein DMUE_2036 [Dictyocoela muelleri]
MARPLKNINKMRYDEIVLMNVNKKRRIHILQRFGIIPKNMKCKSCRPLMKLDKRPSIKVGYSWRCIKCYSRRLIYDQSQLSGCKIDFLKFIKLSYLYFHKNIGPKEAMYDLRIKRDAYYHYKKIFQTAWLRDFLLNDKKLGGPNYEVQIDESCFNKRKYHK